MYRIFELAREVGLSRSTLLYYEKLGLIKGHRLENGYRVYGDKDVQRIRLIQLLQAGGLTLKECQACMEVKIDTDLLKERLERLDEEISYKQQSRRLLAAMVGEGRQRFWHEEADRIAPDIYLDWLNKQGFDEKEALRVKWLSKDMNEHERYMADFMMVFETLDRWGPGSDSATLKALSLLDSKPKKILEIGCGKGVATTVLAKNTTAHIIAVDNEQAALSRLDAKIEAEGLSGRVSTSCQNMMELDFKDASFDVIWCEASAYVMAVVNALKQWKPLLASDGYLILSDLVWLTDTPSQDAVEFWQGEYPDIQTVSTRINQMRECGYQVIDHFTLDHEAFENYYAPLRERLQALMKEQPDSAAFQDISKEIEIYERYFDEFGYEMFVLKLPHDI